MLSHCIFYPVPLFHFFQRRLEVLFDTCQKRPHLLQHRLLVPPLRPSDVACIIRELKCSNSCRQDEKSLRFWKNGFFSQANKIWGPLYLGESRVCEKPPPSHTCIQFSGWQKPHIQWAQFLLSLTTSHAGSCFRSIWTLVKPRFSEFLPRAFLTHHLVYSHVTHFPSKSLLQTSKRIQEWMRSCCFFSKSVCGNRFFPISVVLIAFSSLVPLFVLF